MTLQKLFPFLFLSALVLFACDSGSVESQEDTTSLEDRQQILTGSWQAVWNTDPKAYDGLDSATSYTMNGRFDFGKDGKVTVHTYGYPNCIFASDTNAHTSHWTLTEDYLYLGDEPGPKGISYKIGTLDKDKVTLKLLNDTDLTLYQPNAHQRGKKGKK